MMWWFRTT